MEKTLFFVVRWRKGINARMSSDRTPPGDSRSTPTILDKASLKDALTEALGKLPVLKDFLLNKQLPQKPSEGVGDERTEKDRDKEQEELARKHYQ